MCAEVHFDRLEWESVGRESLEMNDGAGLVVGAEGGNGRELLISFEMMDGIDLDSLESCGYKGRSRGPASETRSDLLVAVEPESGEGGRETAEKGSRIGVV